MNDAEKKKILNEMLAGVRAAPSGLVVVTREHVQMLLESHPLCETDPPSPPPPPPENEDA